MLKTADLRPILPRLLLKTRAWAGRMRRCLFGEGESANFNPDEYILIGIEICTFANAKDGRFASDPAQATIEN